MMRIIMTLLGAFVVGTMTVGPALGKAYLIDSNEPVAVEPIYPSEKKRPRKVQSGTVQLESATSHTFSKTHARFFDEPEMAIVAKEEIPEVVWEKTGLDPFSELIVSWNAFRPSEGLLTVWVSVLYQDDWTRWHRLAQWGPKLQRTFVNKLNPHVHTTHCKMTMLHNKLARGFRIKIGFSGGADPVNLKALFACASRLNHARFMPSVAHLQSVLIQDVPRQSQMVLKHPRYRDLCSPVSTSMIVSYLHDKLYGIKTRSKANFALDFARKAYDQGYVDIFGNWILNVAEAFNACRGEVFFRVERLNSFHDLHQHLLKKIPVAVSVRRLPGGATPYAHGHILVVVGWDKQRQCVLCVDSAFKRSLLRRYPIRSFLRAWLRSNNLAYVPMLQGPLSLENA